MKIEGYKMYLILKNVKFEEDCMYLRHKKETETEEIDVKICKNLFGGITYKGIPLFPSPIYYIEIKKFVKNDWKWEKVKDVEYKEWEEAIQDLSEIYYNDLKLIDKLKWKCAKWIVYFHNLKIGWERAKKHKGSLKYKLFVARKIAKLLEEF